MNFIICRKPNKVFKSMKFLFICTTQSINIKDKDTNFLIK